MFVLFLFAAVPAVCEAQAPAEELLRRVANASAEDLARLADGTPFVKTLETGDQRELTQVYVARLPAPADEVFRRIRTSHLLLDDAEGEGTRGFFDAPATAADVAGLSLARSQVRDLEKCRPGACDLKLPADAIERMHAEVDWEADDAGAQANRFLQNLLAGILDAYVRRGDAAGLTYGDKEEPLAVADGFATLLEDSRHRDAIDPALRSYLAGYPASAPGTEDLFTWTVEDLGLKSMISLNHIAIRPADTPGGASVIGIKRIYSSHYFQAALRVVTVAPATDDPGGDSYVTIFVQYRFDGEFGGIRRIATERRLERNAEAVLSATQERFAGIDGR